MIGPYENLRGVVETTIQINDSFDNDGQGTDAPIGTLASKGGRDILAESLAHREEEGFYDPGYYDDDDLWDVRPEPDGRTRRAVRYAVGRSVRSRSRRRSVRNWISP